MQWSAGLLWVVYKEKEDVLLARGAAGPAWGQTRDELQFCVRCCKTAKATWVWLIWIQHRHFLISTSTAACKSLGKDELISRKARSKKIDGVSHWTPTKCLSACRLMQSKTTPFVTFWCWNILWTLKMKYCYYYTNIHEYKCGWHFSTVVVDGCGCLFLLQNQKN